MREIKKLISRGLYDKDGENQFDLFVSSTEIRWCYYKDSKNILGQTYGMLVLQDFESITANLLCRTIETVEGGGIITILLDCFRLYYAFQNSTQEEKFSLYC